MYTDKFTLHLPRKSNVSFKRKAVVLCEILTKAEGPFLWILLFINREDSLAALELLIFAKPGKVSVGGISMHMGISPRLPPSA